MPCPIIAGIAHYQYATIHPYYDGNGRTARLFATLILHQGGYGLKGVYSLDEYYAKDLGSYYKTLDIGPSHNYYMGRADADITSWLEYFCEGMAKSFEDVKNIATAEEKKGEIDKSVLLKQLDAAQRKVLSILIKSENITSDDIAKLFKLKPRTARALCQRWVEQNFLIIIDHSKKNRKYILNQKIRKQFS